MLKSFVAIALCACGAQPTPVIPIVESGLPAPRELVIDRSTPEVERTVLAARRLYAFWDSGDAKFLAEAIAPTFVDRTLPPGRPQGPTGPAFASERFRAAVPDLRCEVEQLVVANDRAVAHLRFRGHFTGAFDGKQGTGVAVDFLATDILRVTDGRVTDNWHIEDNLTFLQQIGAVTP